MKCFIKQKDILLFIKSSTISVRNCMYMVPIRVRVMTFVPSDLRIYHRLAVISSQMQYRRKLNKYILTYFIHTIQYNTYEYQ